MTAEPLLSSPIGDVVAIDTAMAGERELNAVYVLPGDEPCLVEAAPESDGPTVREGLARVGLGPEDLAHVVVTHIHMDHAGGVGALLEAYPRAVVWVHEVGAPHLVDPTRLLASTARTYGKERMQALYGGMRPVAVERVRTLAGGETLRFGRRTVRIVPTPGHASHHLAILDEATGAVFTGEAIGSYLPWADAYRPALPPPEVDVEAALASIRAIGDVAPTALLTSHFGATPAVEEALDRAAATIRRWSTTVHRLVEADPEVPEAEVVGALAELAAEEFAADARRPLAPELDRYDALGSIRMNAQGLGRYWRKRLAAEAAAGDARARSS